MTNSNDSLWLLAGLIALVIGVVIMANDTFKEPETPPRTVKADVMLKLCFPHGIYTQSAHKYCQKFKDDLMEHLNMRERQLAEKCLNDNVDIAKCVRVK